MKKSKKIVAWVVMIVIVIVFIFWYPISTIYESYIEYGLSAGLLSFGLYVLSWLLIIALVRLIIWAGDIVFATKKSVEKTHSKEDIDVIIKNLIKAMGHEINGRVNRSGELIVNDEDLEKWIRKNV